MMNKEAEMARTMARGIGFLVLVMVFALGWYGVISLFDKVV